MARDFDYKAYLAGPEWAKRREAAVKRAGGRCQLCNSGKNLNVHHRTYARIGNEDPGDLTVLCRRCHAKHHDVLPLGATSDRPVKKKPGRATREKRQAELIEAILATALYRSEGFTAKEMAREVRSSVSKTGAALARMRTLRIVKKRGKVWSRQFSMNSSARLALLEKKAA